MADRLELEARFNDRASAGVKRLGKTLEGVRPSNGMQAAQKWMGEFRGAAEKANVAVRPLATGLSAVGIGGLAASLSMSELVKQFKDLADSTLSMKELGRQSRMSATEIARLQYAAGKLHVDPAAVGGAISSWSGKMVEFRMHVSEFYRYLMRQNADVAAKISADSPVEALKDTLDHISRIKDPQIQKRVADMAGVGDLTPMLGKGPQGLAEAFADAAREVKPISSELQQAADRFNDATNRFNQSWSNLKNDIGPAVLDPLSHTIDKLDGALKFAAQYPGDAAAAAATIAGSLAAFWLRARIMRGSKLAGAGAEAAELAGAAREQVKAGGSLLEAAVALKEAAAELRARGPGGAPGAGAAEPGKPGGKSPGFANLTPAGVLAALNIFDLASRAPEQLKKLQANPDKDVADPSMEWAARTGDAIRHFFQGGASGSDLKKDVQDGSKAGIIAGLREMAQQQDLNGGGSSVRETTGGAPNLRYGRPSASGGFRTTPGRHSAGSAGGDHGTSGPQGVDYNAKSALDQMGIKKGEWDAFREGVTDIEGKRYDRMGGGGGRYAGRYQMGPDEITATAARLGVSRPSNAQFLADPAMQERFFENYTMDHRRALMRDPKFAGLSPREQLKILGYAHNQGAGGPANSRHGANGAWGYLQNGQAGHDGFGTSGAVYPKAIQRRLDQLDSSAAADAFKARQKNLLGTPPQAHATGGSIRGAGGPRSDSIPAWLSNGEFVVNARASGQWLPFLHAINAGHTYADGGQVDAGLSRRRSWLNFFQRAQRNGGMGAPRHVALGATAMMMGESGRSMDPKLYGWDVNGPSGGTAQWHDVTKGRYAGKLHRLSDLMTFAMQQHEDWHSVPVQQANWKREASGPLAGAWRMMRLARTAAGALRQGINRFENPAQHDLEMVRRMPNIVRLARENAGGGATRVAHEIDPIQVDIRHHPHTGKPIVQARAGKGVRLGIRTGPTMRPT